MKQSIGVAGFLALALLALVSGCGGGSSPTSPAPAFSSSRQSSAQFGPLQLSLSASKSSYTVGEQVPLTFTVTNLGSQTVAATFGSATTYIFQVSQGAQTVWFYPQGSAAVITQQSFAPGETQTYTTTWNQTNWQTNAQQSPGLYTMDAWLTPITLNGVNVTSAQQQSLLDAGPIQITIQAQ
jgi:uncharacterized protein YceK